MIYTKLTKPHIYSLLFILLFVLNSCIYEQKSNDKLYLKLEKEIMCPVCQGQTLDQSQSLIAEDMKKIIKLKISEGYNEKEIKNYFIERYGESIIAYPPIRGFNIIAYLVPIFILITAFITFVVFVRGGKSKN
jgi:cytochrome c-type biogenesis protein CcmH